MTFSKNKMVPLKAMMALVIVAGHLTFFSKSPVFMPFHRIGAPIVSIFFFISGYGLFTSHLRKGKEYLNSFFRRRVFRVLVPLLLATLFYWILVAIPERSFFREFNNMVLTGLTILPFSWFAIVILYFYFVFYISGHLSHPTWRNLFLTFCSVLLIIVTVRIGYDRCWWICSLAFPTGAYFARYESRIFHYCEESISHYVVSLLIPICLFLVFYLTGNPYIWTLCYICIPVLIALLVAKIPVERINGPIVSFLSSISYEIYLCQGIPMELFRGKIWINSEILFVCAVYSMTILLSYLVHTISVRLDKLH